MQIIIVGAGRIGRHIIQFATEDKHDVFVIEKNEGLAKEIAKAYDCKVIVADATSAEALKEAEAEDADALVATSNDDAVNMLVMMVAKELEIKHLITFTADESHRDLFTKMGIGTVDSPYLLNARHLYFSVANPSVRDFLHLGGGMEITEFTVKENSPINGKSINQLGDLDGWPDDSHLVVIRRDDDFIIPKGDAGIKEGDVVAVLSDKEAVNKINELFDEKEE